VRSAEWQQSSYLFRCLKEAYNRPKSESQEHDFKNAERFWMQRFPALAEKTRSIVVAGFSAMIDVLNRGVLRELFCSDTNLTPADLEQGKIIVLDLPVTEFGEIGLYAAGIMKYCTQLSLQCRNIQANPRPVFLWQDEGQYFVLPSDSMFQSTCRSYKVATVVLTQNISNFYASMGQNSEALVDGLFGNLNTKIFHANGDFKTCEWMSKLIGRSRQYLASSNINHEPTDPMSSALGIGPSHTSSGVNEVFEYEVQPSVCTTFRTGGPANKW
jgi:type IV secretory pathway TraG/TraD family ATPase VirD4